MKYNRVLTIQDISCLGQCSMTVALPILSACGQETCIIPSAVLSTHTGGFSFPTIRDTSMDIPAIRAHWEKEAVCFDAIYTGYLGTKEQIADVANVFDTMLRPGGKIIVDPAMADHGKLYSGFDMVYAQAMTELCKKADVILPNLTESCLMTGCEYKESYDEAYIHDVLKKLHDMGMKTVVLTGIGYVPGETGVVLSDGHGQWHYRHQKLARSYHGTGPDCRRGPRHRRHLRLRLCGQLDRRQDYGRSGKNRRGLCLRMHQSHHWRREPLVRHQI